MGECRTTVIKCVVPGLTLKGRASVVPGLVHRHARRLAGSSARLAPARACHARPASKIRTKTVEDCETVAVTVTEIKTLFVTTVTGYETSSNDRLRGFFGHNHIRENGLEKS